MRESSQKISTEGYRSGHNEAVLKDYRFCHYDLPQTLVFIRVSALSACTLQDDFLAVFLQFYNLITLEGYRSGHNEAVLKTVCRQARGFESHTLRQKKAHICLPRQCVLFSVKFALAGK